MKFLKFLGARRFGLRTAAELLNLTPAPPRNGFEILKFTPKLSDGFEILKFTLALTRLADTAQNFISRNGFKILKLICEPPRTPSRVLPSADKAEVGRAENFSKFDLTGALLNFKSRFTMQLCSAVTRRNYEAWRSEIYAVCLHKYPVLIRAASGKISRYEVGRATNTLISQGVKRIKFYALNRYTMKFLKFLGANRFGWQTAAWFLKFKPESSHSRPEILNFMFASYKLKLALRKFTLAVRKIKSASAMRLNFDLNSVSQARAAKFENGIKFKGAAKFERSAR